ncbi:MAG: threonine-phosphate decarboxylase [Pseudomonadota bacterium]
MIGTGRDHGGGLDAAIARYGGTRADWIDLSTGINPSPYPLPILGGDAWTALPDSGAANALISAAREFWGVPDVAEVIAAPGASALIAQMPTLAGGAAYIPGPTYNEHAAAFRAHGREVSESDPSAPVHVYVHPNNPDGRRWDDAPGGTLTIIDESFCDVMPEASQIARTATPGTVVLKSFGKFWGLAGLRLGFAIAHPETLSTQPTLTDRLGPWAVSGVAQAVGTAALEDHAWAAATRDTLAAEATKLDRLMAAAGAKALGGTTLFRLYDTADASAAQEHLAQHHIWSRIFPYSSTWLRLGLPPQDRWPQLETALGMAGGVIRAGAASRGNADLPS